jgi:hypothetical protein
MKIKLIIDEVYTAYEFANPDSSGHVEVDVSPEIAERWKRAITEYHAVLEEIDSVINQTEKQNP